MINIRAHTHISHTIIYLAGGWFDRTGMSLVYGNKNNNNNNNNNKTPTTTTAAAESAGIIKFTTDLGSRLIRPVVGWLRNVPGA